ncbi:TPA: transcriptional regulator [candidate division CPR2 bacterium]|uniref:Uncharacterized protein n=1 Tax=candidate division CPR2 bacterium GW2011_GWC1_41_48 TaxID=1618344 RepID=A0A0G0YHP3_UNCC2|nr:MAG: hypothetical protein UT47_C0003G0142 [candidate division CPR2 bacterium GW2011_GWC2_39_35]KKR28365.1 MAG: hypothetical protein UT60_C0022G0021 [candidate division CPR2 bacterium GW2011_GWD2_39_7]KKR29127.1 MAG: hypothetical protein UT59_C0012G0004 [candidate division CPR2 bacterium GW2011_GWD1_39_7]KKS09081.1 MAG: hypothetical protein UU65_C0003G0136 [candidate division CPR2 bacterium GW2011_GWC1_41_48]OGB62142.1 MAG: hypothetical protein A2Y27_00585 [candidate division CPR2 bacterium G
MNEKKDILKRINYVSGQLQGIKRMIEEERDCMEVLQQLKASKSGIHGIISLFAYGELCHQKLDDEKLKRMIRTLVQS